MRCSKISLRIVSYAKATIHGIKNLKICFSNFIDNDLYFAPSGVQKERINADDVFVCSLDGSVKDGPGPEKGLKQSQCTPLFMVAYQGKSEASFK